MSRTRLVAMLAGLGVAGLVAASAATLGTITSDDLGSGVTVVASCDSDGLNLGYTVEYDSVEGAYIVTDVNVSGIDADCAGQALSLTLKDGTGASVGAGTIPSLTADPIQTVAMTPTPEAEVVVGAAVIIAG